MVLINPIYVFLKKQSVSDLPDSDFTEITEIYRKANMPGMLNAFRA